MCGRYSLDTPLQALQALLPTLVTGRRCRLVEPLRPTPADPPRRTGAGPQARTWTERDQPHALGAAAGLGQGSTGGAAADQRPRRDVGGESLLPWSLASPSLPAAGRWISGARGADQRQDQQLFWLAGLWDRWIGPDGSEVETCCVITTRPNALLESLHDRMPSGDSPRARGDLAGRGMVPIAGPSSRCWNHGRVMDGADAAALQLSLFTRA